MAEAGEGPPHLFEVRIYYEDTDLGGIVYHANHLKFIERARTEWLRACGVDQMRLRAEAGVVFVVRRIEADYLRPAVFADLLQIRTALIELGGARVVLQQDIWRDGAPIFKARVVLVCVGQDGRAARVPDRVRAALM